MDLLNSNICTKNIKTMLIAMPFAIVINTYLLGCKSNHRGKNIILQEDDRTCESEIDKIVLKYGSVSQFENFETAYDEVSSILGKHSSWHVTDDITAYTWAGNIRYVQLLKSSESNLVGLEVVFLGSGLHAE
tara:strand:- start:542 stop:937 length:396 start_codon:yes stop_codon:yes gene_type:complete